MLINVGVWVPTNADLYSEFLVMSSFDHNSSAWTVTLNRLHIKEWYIRLLDRLCGLVVRVPGYRFSRSRVPFPSLPDFLRSSGSGTGSTQPREDNWGATWMEN
jgi:hypothetical protein